MPVCFRLGDHRRTRVGPGVTRNVRQICHWGSVAYAEWLKCAAGQRLTVDRLWKKLAGEVDCSCGQRAEHDTDKSQSFDSRATFACENFHSDRLVECVFCESKTRCSPQVCELPLLAVKRLNDENGLRPIFCVVVLIRVELYEMRGPRGRDCRPLRYGKKLGVEIRRRHFWVHAIGRSAPDPVGPLLEETSTIRSCCVSSVENTKAGLAQRGHHRDRLSPSGGFHIATRLHDVCSIHQSVLTKAGHGSRGNVF